MASNLYVLTQLLGEYVGPIGDGGYPTQVQRPDKAIRFPSKAKALAWAEAHDMGRVFGLAARKMRPEVFEAEAVAKADRHEERLNVIRQAIRDGRAYLDTFVGRRRVTSYNDMTGNAITNNGTDAFGQRTFMICLDAIKIGD